MIKSKKDIHRFINKPTTPDDIYKISKKQFNMILYSDIHKYDNIDQLFGNKRFVIILYEYKPENGHYILLMKTKKTIEYFDSIYRFPDFVLKLLDEKTRANLNEDELYLCDLLEKSDYNIEYNAESIQKKGTACCGCWCALRMAFPDCSVEDFIWCFKQVPDFNPDEVCTALSINRSGGW